MIVGMQYTIDSVVFVLNDNPSPKTVAPPNLCLSSSLTTHAIPIHIPRYILCAISQSNTVESMH